MGRTREKMQENPTSVADFGPEATDGAPDNGSAARQGRLTADEPGLFWG